MVIITIGQDSLIAVMLLLVNFRHSSNLGQILANLSTSKAGDVAGIYGQQANLATGTQQGLGQLFAGEGTTAGNILVGAGSEQSQLAQNLGVAQSGGQLYAAQNSPAWAQGLQSGLSTYTGMGGTFGQKKH
ncbi:MAG: hypothetical protein IPK77_11260 [Cellvibrio sp.]|nr:hypothetical protein [Cellvibrio sp.]